MTAHQKRFLDRLGEEIREYRDAAGLSGQVVADFMDWSRDAIAKIENGHNNMTVYDYLRLVDFLREVIPEDHPALALRDRLIPRATRSTK